MTYPQQPPQQPYPYYPPVQPTVMPVRTNHAMHLMLSVISCGLWLPVWIFVAMINSSRTRKIY
ncbi:membrane protein [Mycobacterium phage Yecey3]|uniref:Membrane protein n=1 Tax=Mycobacterium phage Yecey3 TaxID=2656617 RepID=A0A649V9G6_9CAUD|nr:membrane protein [Mycobacterium phage Yecey3]QGJ88789.1 membrane protein [Mycobacterium phage Yecey3]